MARAIKKEPITDSIITFIRDRFPSAGDDVTDGTPLLEGGAIDSLGVLELMCFLTETYGLTIADEDFVPENFETVAHLVRFVEVKRDVL